eukprot:NODE_10340_length_338_cov_59.885813_g9429_i0.p1 GENE.NODE_10340_length_338_cov_59.885813_g9429_i0~~NODE_10340_length_338_cov_59.885813_g9429_i0.p1  ORF type:complete len:86 (+),score=23.48 NODE_10340_length_338_cov_59.885813_g9429_i0:31-288(+)
MGAMKLAIVATQTKAVMIWLMPSYNKHYSSEVMAGAWSAMLQNVLFVGLVFVMLRAYPVEDCQLHREIVIPENSDLVDNAGSVPL